MASFDSVNYSIRPSKSVQRGITFQGLRRIFEVMDLGNAIYVGFGSIWFTDFVQAHKLLDIDDMVSIEANEVGFRRATFNKAYRTISVMEGRASARLPDILELEGYSARPWVVWLDYDSALDEEVVDDMQWVLSNASPNSIVLFTVSATQNAYGNKPIQRPERIRALLGDVVPDNLSKDDCMKETLPNTLADLMMDFLKSEVADTARPGGFIEAFKLPYLDSVAMVTVGGILPAKGAAAAARALVAAESWNGHGCKWGQLPKSRPGYWKPKIETNRERDRRALTELREARWEPLVVWQCELRDLEGAVGRVEAFLRS